MSSSAVQIVSACRTRPLPEAAQHRNTDPSTSALGFTYCQLSECTEMASSEQPPRLLLLCNARARARDTRLPTKKHALALELYAWAQEGYDLLPKSNYKATILPGSLTP